MCNFSLYYFTQKIIARKSLRFWRVYLKWIRTGIIVHIKKFYRTDRCILFKSFNLERLIHYVIRSLNVFSSQCFWIGRSIQDNLIAYYQATKSLFKKRKMNNVCYQKNKNEKIFYLMNGEKQYPIMAVICTFYERIYKYCYKDQDKNMPFFIITCHH